MSQQISNELPEIESGETLHHQPGGPEFSGGAEYTEVAAQQRLEQGQPVAAAPAPIAQQTAIAPAVPAPSVPSSVPTDDSLAVNATIPQIADDSDLIEKEWVLKAKEIVERTKHDPYQQNKEVERMKADYMQKRYNKKIKITDE